MSKRIRGNYQKISKAEKQSVIDLKNEGRASSEIAKILKINVKTVASIKQAERKCDSKEIKEVLMEAMRKLPVPCIQGDDLFEIRRNLRQHIRHEINNPDNLSIQTAIEKYNEIKRKKFDPKNRKIIEWVTNQYMDEFQNRNQKVEYLEQFQNKNEKVEYVNQFYTENHKVEYMQQFQNKNQKCEFMNEFLNENKNQNCAELYPWHQSFINFLMSNQYKFPTPVIDPTTGLKQFKPIITIKPS